MKKLIPILIFLLIIAVGAGVLYSYSNLALVSATATFSEDENSRNMNALTVTAPYGYNVIYYHVVPRTDLTETNKQTPFTIGGYGFSGAVGLFGDDVTLSNTFPSRGRVEDIALETHVRISERLDTVSTAKLPEDEEILDGCGIYLLVTRNYVSSDKLKAMVERWTRETVPGGVE